MHAAHARATLLWTWRALRAMNGAPPARRPSAGCSYHDIGIRPHGPRPEREYPGRHRTDGAEHVPVLDQRRAGEVACCDLHGGADPPLPFPFSVAGRRADARPPRLRRGGATAAAGPAGGAAVLRPRRKRLLLRRGVAAAARRRHHLLSRRSDLRDAARRRVPQGEGRLAAMDGGAGRLRRRRPGAPADRRGLRLARDHRLHRQRPLRAGDDHDADAAEHLRHGPRGMADLGRAAVRPAGRAGPLGAARPSRRAPALPGRGGRAVGDRLRQPLAALRTGLGGGALPVHADRLGDRLRLRGLRRRAQPADADRRCHHRRRRPVHLLPRAEGGGETRARSDDRARDGYSPRSAMSSRWIISARPAKPRIASISRLLRPAILTASPAS